MQDTDTAHGIRALQPDGTPIVATKTCMLKLTNLPEAARKAHKFPQLAGNALISIPVLCDNGCEVKLTREKITVSKDGQEIIEGKRDEETRLWRIRLEEEAPVPENNDGIKHHINAMIPDGTVQDAVNFMHRALFSPTTSTLIKAIDNGNLATWPMLTSDNIKKHLSKSEATTLGHLDQTRKNIQSTKSEKQDKDDDKPIEQEPKTEHVYAAIINPQETTGKIYTDQTGQFPTVSSRGNKYLMVLYDYDSNAILAEPLKSRKQQEILRAYKVLVNCLEKRGLRPKLQTLDNEASQLLKDEMDSRRIKWQLVPPDIHRRNAAERAIRTYKNHVLAGLASTDPNFPLHLWDRIIKQATTTLNLLRQSRINPRLSAEAQLNGQFDFNATPMAPPGTKIIIHEKPNKRGSWAPHGAKGWYLGPASNHYRCWTVYVTKTASERIGDTVEFFPHQGRMPRLSSADTAVKAALELTTALQHPSPAAPFAPINQQTMNALETLASIFKDQAQNKRSQAPRVGAESKNPTNTHPYPTRAKAATVQHMVMAAHHKQKTKE